MIMNEIHDTINDNRSGVFCNYVFDYSMLGVGMGIYLNPGNDAFRMALNDDIYVDKSGLIPNEEVREEFVRAVKNGKHTEQEAKECQ